MGFVYSDPDFHGERCISGYGGNGSDRFHDLPFPDRHFSFTSVPFGECFITTGADITGIKKAEESLRARNEELTRLNNAMVGRELRMIELMWRAALADAHVSAHEQHALRRIAELLHIPHGDYIAAKARAQASPG